MTISSFSLAANSLIRNYYTDRAKFLLLYVLVLDNYAE